MTSYDSFFFLLSNNSNNFFQQAVLWEYSVWSAWWAANSNPFNFYTKCRQKHCWWYKFEKMQKHNQKKKKINPIIMPSKILLRFWCECWQMCSFSKAFPSTTPQDKQVQWLIISRRKCFFFLLSPSISVQNSVISAQSIECLQFLESQIVPWNQPSGVFFFKTHLSWTHRKRSHVC